MFDGIEPLRITVSGAAGHLIHGDSAALEHRRTALAVLCPVDAAPELVVGLMLIVGYANVDYPALDGYHLSRG